MKILPIAILSLLLISCADNSRLNQASQKIEDSFGFNASVSTNQSEIGVDKAQVYIKEAALNKEFLMRSQLIDQAKVTTFTGMKSRVVSFMRKGNSIYLLEATKGQNVSVDIDNTIVLAEFPIIKEENQNLYFDFDKGMARLFTSADWKAPDYGSGNDYSNNSVEVSYLDTVELTKTNVLKIEQVSMASNIPFKTIYYITPYIENKNFKITPVKNFKQFGYFTNSTTFNKHGRQQDLATKFDINKGFTFSVSANTPKEFQQAVKDGVLYWNKAFGSDVLKVNMAPAGLSAPDPDYNIIQWVDWKDAGMAYADAQMDPRTGEILNAQVFMTSVFAESAKNKYAFIDADIDTHKSHGREITIKGFEKEHLCRHDFNDHIRSSLSSLLFELNKIGASNDTVKEMIKDYIREVVAHEVGHTLGLRHNFAGSLALNYKLSDSKKLLKQYKDETLDPEISASSSVMDYNATIPSAFIGYRMRKGKALDYDKAAIENLYKGVDFDLDASPIFCTDSTVSHYYDCERFDEGADPISFVQYRKSLSDSQIRDSIMRSFLRSKAPDEGVVKLKLNEVSLPLILAAINGSMAAELINSFRAGEYFLKYNHKYLYNILINEEEIQDIRINEFVDIVKSFGGLSAIVPALEKSWVQEQIDAFSTDLSGKYSKLKNSNGQFIIFTDAEKNQMKKMVADYYNKYFIEYQNELVRSLGKITENKETRKLVDNAYLNIEIPNYIKALLKPIVLDRSSDVLVASIKQKILRNIEVDSGKDDDGDGENELITEEQEKEIELDLTLPVYAYSQKLRKDAATNLQMRNWSQSPSFGSRVRAELKEYMSNFDKSLLGSEDATMDISPYGIKKKDLSSDEEIKLSDFKSEELDPELADWFINYKSIKTALGLE